MASVPPHVRRNLFVGHHGPLSFRSCSLRSSGVLSRVAQASSTESLAHAQGSAIQPRPLLQVLSILVLACTLLGASGCAGGFQGFKPVAATITQPASVTVSFGQTATFSVTASGAGTLTYQWYKNGAAIIGATSSSYTTPPTVSSDTGAVFTVTVSNSAGTVTSGPSTLTVQIPAPLAKSLVPSATTPAYNSSVLLIPTFSGGTATIGSTGVGSSDIST